MQGKYIRYDGLDLVRGLSAILVCASHLRAELFVDFDQLQHPNFFDRIFYFVTGLGHQAVIVFFVLSGFFVGGSVLSSGRFFFATYAVARLSRLWTVLLPALIITAGLDAVTQYISPTTIAGARYNEWNSGPMAGTYSQTASTFFLNIFFLQTIAAPVFGTNGPLWSLANEFWYYLIFPLMTNVAAITGNYRTLTRLILAVILAMIFLMLPSRIIEGFFVWLMGVAIYAHSGRFIRKRRILHLLIALAVFCLSLFYSKLDSWNSAFDLSSDLVVGLGFSVLCLVIACWSNSQIPPTRFSWRSFGRMTSEFSYSLYLVHFPVLVFLSVSVLPILQMNPGGIGYAIYFGAMAFLVGSGYFFWLAFERQTPIIRRLVLSKMSRFGLA